MHLINRHTITPIPTDEEAAALSAAITAHLAAQRAAVPARTPGVRPWPLAGRLASHESRRSVGGRRKA